MNINEIIEQKSQERRNAILNTKTEVAYNGKAYYVAADGDDYADGSEKTPWRSLKRVTEADLNEGDAVFFKRNDIFRGQLKVQNGVTYSAYGEGKKPTFYGSPENGANPDMWELYDAERNIWVYKKPLRDVGVIVFNDGESWSCKVLADYNDGFTIRDTDAEPFDMKVALDSDLKHFCNCADTEGPNGRPSRLVEGELYLRCEKGNPGEVYNSIEFNTVLNIVDAIRSKNVLIDNLCLKYGGSHGVGAGSVINLRVQNCEIGWIGGAIQLYNPKGRAVRYGNGVEVCTQCDGYMVKNNWVYQCYDAGVTHQQGARGGPFIIKDVVYKGNLIEDCIYGVEYFMYHSEEDPTYVRLMDNILIEDNIIRRAGYGFGIQRPDKGLEACIMGWWRHNDAKNFICKDNILDRSVQYLVSVSAIEEESVPKYMGNTYVQHKGKKFGRIGKNLPGLAKDNNPYYNSMQDFDEKIEEYLNEKVGDTQSKVYFY